MMSPSHDLRRSPEAEDDNGQKDQHEGGKMALQQPLDRLAEIVDQSRQHEEPRAARDQRQQQEQEEIVAQQPRDDGDELVGNGREALHQDEGPAPFVVEDAQGVDFLGIAVKADQPLPERVVEGGADIVAENAARDRGDGANPGVEPGFFRLGQRHRHENHIRRNREERTFREGDEAQRPGGARALGERQGPVVKAFEHGNPLIRAIWRGLRRPRR
jgi:hypothetical protein